MFLTVFLARGAEGILVALAVEAANVVATPTALGPFLFYIPFHILLLHSLGSVNTVSYHYLL